MRNRDRHSKHRGNNWKNSSRNENGTYAGNSSSQQKKHFVPPKAVTAEQIRHDEEAIRAFKSENRPLCAHCGQPITDMASALALQNGNPIHFDCALEIIDGQEKLGEGEKISYIGQGRFGVVYFPNAHDVKHFVIRKIIEWEDKEHRLPWRDEMSELYSHVK
ncbi:MAG: hypothetical protein II103_01450 [Treponema sp.]|nr:hypothetical protein [Treponema sp.]MBQ4024028.1 hypothetical protein [Treponema sp.]